MNQKKAEEIFWALCEQHNLPKISVAVVPPMPHDYAIFKPDDYTVEVGSDATEFNIIHEFSHYVFRLVSVVPHVEEEICDGFASGILHTTPSHQHTSEVEK